MKKEIKVYKETPKQRKERVKKSGNAYLEKVKPSKKIYDRKKLPR